MIAITVMLVLLAAAAFAGYAVRTQGRIQEMANEIDNLNAAVAGLQATVTDIVAYIELLQSETEIDPGAVVAATNSLQAIKAQLDALLPVVPPQE